MATYQKYYEEQFVVNSLNNIKMSQNKPAEQLEADRVGFDWDEFRAHINAQVVANGRQNVGIVGADVYFPKEFVSQKDLEDFDGVGSGKYQIGLGQKNMAVCNNSEDIVSMCMTAVENLLTKYGIDRRDIGRIEVGTETIADKSKSVKTFLMSQFNEAGCYDILGIDTMNACYGGTSALLNAVNWIESSSWDGRYAIVVAGDIAVYEQGPARPTGGAGVVAMLVGPHAPISLETKQIASHMEHVYDFYKPHMDSEYPVVDGKLSNDCYMRSIDSCYSRYKFLYEKANEKPFSVENDSDFVILHSPYTKLVQKSFARLCIADSTPEDRQKLSEEFGEFEPTTIHKNRDLEKAVMDLHKEKFTQSVSPGLLVSQECGNMYTGSVYASLCSLISSQDAKLDKRALVFSYGSGSAASMFSLRFNRGVDKMRTAINLQNRLSQRTKLTPEEYTQRLSEREQKYKSGVPTQIIHNEKPTNMFPGTYYVKSIDPLGRRQYARTFSTGILRAARYLR
mmetsp:Transcript_1533/g.2336  ORF Transcript_1533/g.2336 Transcript_1533/m.2336 type:complete len:509 (-) Transcript_1533:1649-3175(-)